MHGWLPWVSKLTCSYNSWLDPIFVCPGGIDSIGEHCQYSWSVDRWGLFWVITRKLSFCRSVAELATTSEFQPSLLHQRVIIQTCYRLLSAALWTSLRVWSKSFSVESLPCFWDLSNIITIQYCSVKCLYQVWTEKLLRRLLVVLTRYFSSPLLLALRLWSLGSKVQSPYCLLSWSRLIFRRWVLELLWLSLLSSQLAVFYHAYLGFSWISSLLSSWGGHLSSSMCS